MRTKSSKTLYFDFSGESSIKVAKEYRAKYEAISQILDINRQILRLAHGDWAKLLSTSAKGRDGYTSEQLLRALIVMFLEGDGYRDVVVRIDTSEFLQYFVRLGVKPTMDYSFLCKALCALTEPTMEALNEALARYAVQEEKISGEKQRMDTTVYETNIHYPTDSSLLWDSFRTLSRLLRKIQKELPQLNLRHRFHDKKVKKFYTFISRNASSKSKQTLRKVKSAYRELINRVSWIHGVGQRVLVQARSTDYLIDQLDHYLPLVEQIIYQADQRVLQGVSLAPDEKLYSLFEEHTELIKRGKAAKPIEFGHKVLFCQTGEKFIHHYKVMPQRIEDKELLAPAVEAHKDLFGHYPDVLSTDKGFYESMKQISSLEEKIATVSIAKKGRRNQEEYQRETTEEFIDGQRFRAGSEGSISVLKRAFKLGKCFFKGFKHYAASVGLAVLCHNLVLLTRL
ncbi:MAG: ISNCY family transposase [Deltaproteobacteria bacterium]|nr:ISNCY family transposase [Deltaproteobacteria bacterium]